MRVVHCLWSVCNGQLLANTFAFSITKGNNRCLLFQSINSKSINTALKCIVNRNNFFFIFLCLKIQWKTLSRRTSKLLTLAKGRCSQHTPSGLVWPSTSQSSTMKSSTTRTRPAAWLRRYELDLKGIVLKSL